MQRLKDMKLFVCAASLTIKPRHKHNPTRFSPPPIPSPYFAPTGFFRMDEVLSQSSGFSAGPHICANRIMPRVKPEKKKTPSYLRRYRGRKTESAVTPAPTQIQMPKSEQRSNFLSGQKPEVKDGRDRGRRGRSPAVA